MRITCESPVIDGLNEVLNGSVVTAASDHVEEVVVVTVLADLVAAGLVLSAAGVVINVTQLLIEGKATLKFSFTPVKQN